MKDNCFKKKLLNWLQTYRMYKSRTIIFFQYQKQRKYIRCLKRTFVNPIEKNDKVLILVPHADDELISCHTFIKENLDKTTLFYCSLTGSNPSVDNKQIRKSEFSEYCKSVGVKYIESESDNLFIDFISVLDLIKPTTIFLPSYIDWHKEHILMSELLNEYLIQITNTTINKIVVYSVSFPMHYNFVNMVCPMTKADWNNKWRTFGEVYISQRSLLTYRFKCWERLYSFVYSLDYATEYYHYFSLKDWMLWYAERQNVLLKSSIVGHMKEVLRTSKELYNC